MAMEKSFTERGVPQWIEHTKVILSRAEKILAVRSQVPELATADTLTVQLAAILHDIGKNKDGKNHEVLGGELARNILKAAGFDTAMIDRVACIVSAHHGYDGIVAGVSDTPEWYIIRLADYAQSSYPPEADSMAAITRKSVLAEMAKFKARKTAPAGK